MLNNVYMNVIMKLPITLKLDNSREMLLLGEESMAVLRNEVHTANREYRVSKKKCPQDCLNNISGYKHARQLRHILFER